MSYGVAICLQGSFDVEQLEPLVRAGLASLTSGAFFTASRSGRYTLLSQGDGDHSRLWENERQIFALGASLARALRCRVWVLRGYSGTVNHLVIEAFGAKGTREWSAKHSPALRRFMKQAGFEREPFELFTKPFLELDETVWRDAGSIEVAEVFDASERIEMTPVQGELLAELFGRRLPGVKGWAWREEFDDGVTISHLFLERKPPMTTLGKLGLVETDFPQPRLSERRGDRVMLPDGKSTMAVSNSSVRGIRSTRWSNTVELRWGFAFSARGKDWLQVCHAEGPYVREFNRLAAAERAVMAAELAEEGLERDEPKRLLRAIADGGLDREELTSRAAALKKWKCFEALLRGLSPKKAQAARDALLNELDWRVAVKHGADLNGPIDELRTRLLHTAPDAATAKALLAAGAKLDVVNLSGRTPLHLTEDPGVALVLITAGAPLGREDIEGHTPLRHQLRRLGRVVPSARDVEVIAAMLKRGAEPRGPELLEVIAPWKGMKTHASAWKALSRLSGSVSQATAR